MKRFLLFLIVAVSMVNLMAQTTYRVTAQSLKVRSSPSTRGQIAGKLSKGEIVYVEFIENGWATINYNGKTRYISAQYIVEQTIDPQQQEITQQKEVLESQPEPQLAGNATPIPHNYSDNNNHEDAYRGLVFGFSTGCDFGLKEGESGLFVIETEIGKRFNKNFYWGGGVGVGIPMNSSGNIGLPITTNVKAFFPSSKAKVVPLVMFRAGYHLDIDNADYSSIILQLMPGLQFPLSSKADLLIMAGYMRSIFPKGGGGNMLGFKAGLYLHKGGTRVKKVLPPSYEHCFQVGLEPCFTYSSDLKAPLLAVIASYKLSRLLSFGLGYGFGGNLEGKEFTQHRVFARGQYRLSDRRCSSFVGCDLGYFTNKHTNGYFDSSNGFFVSPGVGLSVRSSANSYLDFRLGYELGPKVKEEKSYEKESIKMSGFTFRINFTRTLK